MGHFDIEHSLCCLSVTNGRHQPTLAVLVRCILCAAAVPTQCRRPFHCGPSCRLGCLSHAYPSFGRCCIQHLRSTRLVDWIISRVGDIDFSHKRVESAEQAIARSTHERLSCQLLDAICLDGNSMLGRWSRFAKNWEGWHEKGMNPSAICDRRESTVALGTQGVIQSTHFRMLTRSCEITCIRLILSFTLEASRAHVHLVHLFTILVNAGMTPQSIFLI